MGMVVLVAQKKIAYSYAVFSSARYRDARASGPRLGSQKGVPHRSLASSRPFYCGVCDVKTFGRVGPGLENATLIALKPSKRHDPRPTPTHEKISEDIC